MKINLRQKLQINSVQFQCYWKFNNVFLISDNSLRDGTCQFFSIKNLMIVIKNSFSENHSNVFFSEYRYENKILIIISTTQPTNLFLIGSGKKPLNFLNANLH